MPQTVLITGTGRPFALGYNLVRRYLEQGDTVLASIRRPSEALETLKKSYPEQLHILTMDIASTESVNAAAMHPAPIFSRRSAACSSRAPAGPGGGRWSA